MSIQFSVILATRNRPALFAEALASVLAQGDARLEVVVVADGCEPALLPDYEAIWTKAVSAAPIQVIRLPVSPRGHGQSHALNMGVAAARGDYVAFLDDDDAWTDPGYLCRLAALLAASPEPPDLLLADQAAFRDGVPAPGPIWIEDLGERLARRGPAVAEGGYRVTPAELLTAHGFCHLNTTVVRRALFLEIGGLDESIRYECDRDFYLRAIDVAARIVYRPGVVSRHNIPDPARQASMSTAVSALEKRVFQLRVLDRGILFARDPAIRSHAHRHKGYVLQAIAEELARRGRFAAAGAYAREALAFGRGPKWAAYAAYLSLRGLFSGGERRAAAD